MVEGYARTWSSRFTEGVASFLAEDGQIGINNGAPIRGRPAIAEMVAGFYPGFPIWSST